MSNLIEQAACRAGLEVIDYRLEFERLCESAHRVSHIIVHHDIWPGGTMEQIHQDHIHHRGWSGVGYHARVTAAGKIELGRPHGYIGAHCKEQSMNHRSVGIVFEGNFDKQEISEEQFSAGARFISELVKLSGIQLENIKGHCDYASYKSCPGRLFPLDSLRKRVADNLSGAADVSSWAREAWLWVKKSGISDGTRPKDEVTMEEIWVMLHSMAKRAGIA